MTKIYRTLLWATLAIAPQWCVAAKPDDASATAEKAKSPAKSEEGFVTLFDGKSLDGWWKQDKVPNFHVGGKFEVVDGLLVAQQDPPGKGGFLATKGKYSDFIFRAEVNMDYPSDSGVFVRMADDGKSHQITLDNRPDGQFGRIYLPWTQSNVHDSPDGIKSFKQKEWNDIEIRIEGEPSRIRFWLNGTLVTDFQHTAETTKGVPREGYIALQVHPTVTTHVNWKEGNRIRYRNIRIHPLTAEELAEEKPQGAK